MVTVRAICQSLLLITNYSPICLSEPYRFKTLFAFDKYNAHLMGAFIFDQIFSFFLYSVESACIFASSLTAFRLRFMYQTAAK